MNAKSIGKQIKEYRKINNVSQRELAEQLFVSDKTISRWELGNGLPDIELLPKIAEILGISIDKLVGAEDATDEEGNLKAIDEYKAELNRLEALLEQKEQAERADAENKAKIKKSFIISAFVVAAVLICILIVCSLIKPKYRLTVIGVENNSYTLLEGASLPEIKVEGKTVLGFIDEEYNFYEIDGFSMPNYDLTLRPLFKEEMPLFAGSDSDQSGQRVSEHILLDGGIPATKYSFSEGAVKGTSIQSRPASDSGSLSNINVYAPSLGERFILLYVKNESDIDVSIKYRVENYGENHGGLDYYTPSLTIKAGASTYMPVYFKNDSNFGTFEGCDHFVILDQDIDSQVDLTIYGYLYVAEELSSIEIVKAPNKFVYTEGEQIDLSGMVVKANLHRGAVTGQVTIFDYTCDLEGKTWTKGMDVATISYAGKSAQVVINDPFSYKIAFTPAKNLESINDTHGADYISARYTVDDKGMPATIFTLSPGGLAGMEVEAWINQEIDNTRNNGLNLRIPTFSGMSRYLDLTVTNNGGQEVTFYYYAENYGNKGGVEITVAPGETVTVDFKVDPGNSLGCNYAFRLMSDVEVETTLTINGYFYCRNELDGIDILCEADKLTFRPGESFDRSGLVIRALGEKYDDVVISNFTTDLDGYIFTEADVGIKTVTVALGDLSVIYDIEIVN